MIGIAIYDGRRDTTSDGLFRGRPPLILSSYYLTRDIELRSHSNCTICCAPQIQCYRCCEMRRCSYPTRGTSTMSASVLVAPCFRIRSFLALSSSYAEENSISTIRFRHAATRHARDSLDFSDSYAMALHIHETSPNLVRSTPVNRGYHSLLQQRYYEDFLQPRKWCTHPVPMLDWSHYTRFMNYTILLV